MTYEDTYNTLKYADRAKNIQSNVSLFSSVGIFPFFMLYN